MNQNLKHISLVVKDYDEAIEFYIGKLNFELIEDTKLSEKKRWVLIKPKGMSEFSLLLAKAADEPQNSRIGNQTGGRVFLFLNTDNFDRDYNNLITQKVTIVREPTLEDYGKVAVFADLYGNLWDLIEPKVNKQSLCYSTVILKVKDSKNINLTAKELLKLQAKTKDEIGNISFDIQQSREDPMDFVIWECFDNGKSFKEHLESKHLKKFLSLNFVELERGIVAEKLT